MSHTKCQPTKRGKRLKVLKNTFLLFSCVFFVRCNTGLKGPIVLHHLTCLFSRVFNKGTSKNIPKLEKSVFWVTFEHENVKFPVGTYTVFVSLFQLTFERSHCLYKPIQCRFITFIELRDTSLSPSFTCPFNFVEKFLIVPRDSPNVENPLIFYVPLTC